MVRTLGLQLLEWMAGESMYTLSEEAAGNLHPRPSSTVRGLAAAVRRWPPLDRWIYGTQAASMHYNRAAACHSGFKRLKPAKN